MKGLHHSDDRHSKERVSEYKRTVYRRKSHKAGPSRSNPKRVRYRESFGNHGFLSSSVEGLSKANAEDDCETRTSYTESLSSGIDEKDNTRSCPLRLRIAFPQSSQGDDNYSSDSKWLGNNKQSNGEKVSLRLRIRLPNRNEAVAGLNTFKGQFEYKNAGQSNTLSRRDWSELSRGPQRRLARERCEVSDRKESLNHGNQLCLRIHNSKYPSKIDARGNCKTHALVRNGVNGRGVETNSEGIGCARTEYVHSRRERSKLPEDRAVSSQRNPGLFITYDSRKRRTHSPLPQLYLSKSRIHGQGVFTRNRIKKGVIILEFFGEIVRESVSDVRERRYLQGGMRSFYVFSLVGRERKGDKLCLDSTRKGGLGRFINHSCRPNAEAMIRDGGIVIKAIADVESGQEITLDYKMDEGGEICRCGEKKCAGVMGESR